MNPPELPCNFYRQSFHSITALVYYYYSTIIIVLIVLLLSLTCFNAQTGMILVCDLRSRKRLGEDVFVLHLIESQINIVPPEIIKASYCTSSIISVLNTPGSSSFTGALVTTARTGWPKKRTQMRPKKTSQVIREFPRRLRDNHIPLISSNILALQVGLLLC